MIAHASGGTLDIVQNEKTGFLFNDLDDCAALLRKVCLSDQRDIIRQAQKYAIDNLSTDMYGSRILEVYYSILQ